MGIVEKKNMEIDAIILSYGSLHYANISISQTFAMCIQHLQELYELTSKEEYLHVALLHIRAYMQMGFNYEENQELFGLILRELHLPENSFTSKYMYANKLIKLTRPQVRSMIGKWMPSAANPLKIGEVVDDIIDKVSHQTKGIHTYVYTSGKTKYIYELVISEEECFFHDARKRKYYFFDIPEKG